MHHSPDHELHLAPASCVHQDGNQLWVSWAEDAMRPNSNCEETLLLVTCPKNQLKDKEYLKLSKTADATRG